MKKQVKKLKLTIETVRNLEVGRVVGGNVESSSAPDPGGDPSSWAWPGCGCPRTYYC